MVELIGTLTGIFTSVVALGVSVWVFRSEKQLSMNSVRPWLNAFCGSHRNVVYVRIGNYGMGPAIIKEVHFESCDGTEYDFESLAHHVLNKAKAAGVDVGTFYDYIPKDALLERAVAPEGNLFLIEYRSEDPARCDFVKQALADVAIKIRYADIFGNLMEETCERDCGWLGCHTCEDDGPDLSQDEKNVGVGWSPERVGIPNGPA